MNQLVRLQLDQKAEKERAQNIIDNIMPPHITKQIVNNTDTSRKSSVQMSTHALNPQSVIHEAAPASPEDEEPPLCQHIVHIL
jgi:hypothetical protein